MAPAKKPFRPSFGPDGVGALPRDWKPPRVSSKSGKTKTKAKESSK